MNNTKVAITDHKCQNGHILAFTSAGSAPVHISADRLEAYYYARGYDQAEAYALPAGVPVTEDNADDCWATYSVPFEHWLHATGCQSQVHEALSEMLSSSAVDPLAKALADLRRITDTHKPDAARLAKAQADLARIKTPAAAPCPVASVTPDIDGGTLDIEIIGMIGDRATQTVSLQAYCEFMESHYRGVRRDAMFQPVFAAAFLDRCHRELEAQMDAA